MRPISTALAAFMRDYKSQPDYRIYAFRPYEDSYTKIITNPTACHPLDITDLCSEISWTPTQVEFTFKDSTGDFNPDGGQYRSYLADGCILRLKEGDSRVSEDQWVWTFTGAIRGQLGWVMNRAKKTLESKVTVYSRDNTSAFKKRQMTTQNYTKGSDLGVALRDICKLMGITDGEIRIPYTLGRSFYFNNNQICQLAPWDGMSQLLEVAMGVPTFDGEGKLNYYSKNMNRPADVVFNDDSYILDYQVVARADDAINKVQVTFLDSNMTKVGSTCQKLGEANITTGFFTFAEHLDCYFSQDKKQRAENTFMKVIKSINANLLPIGSESYEQIDDFHGEITISIGIWVPLLATAMLAAYVASAFIPDYSTPGQPIIGVAMVAGTGPMPVIGTTKLPHPTLSWGKVIQAAALIGIMYIMMCLGSCQYEIWGIPYDMAYIEKRSIAIVEGIEYYEENELNIKNDFVGTQDWSDTLAMTELTYQQSKACPRQITIRDYLGLEIGDIIQLEDGRKICISNMKKTIKRGQNTPLVIDGFKVLTY
jgi:hypothetical protein